MIEISKVPQSNIEYKEEVIELIQEAEKYLKSFDWCKEIVRGWLVEDFGYILCIFSFEIQAAEGSAADTKVWIIVGDIPPAYIDIESAPTAKMALEAYCFLMEDWIGHIKVGKSVKECYPLEVPATKEYAEMLATRVQLIREDFLPDIE